MYYTLSITSVMYIISSPRAMPAICTQLLNICKYLGIINIIYYVEHKHAKNCSHSVTLGNILESMLM